MLEVRKTQVRRVWSSIKITNHCFPKEVVTLDRPQTSLWTRVKGRVDLKDFKEKRLDVVSLACTYHKIKKKHHL